MARWFLRGLWAVVGLTAFIWMGYEDQGRSFVVVLGALIAVSSAATYLLRGGSPAASPRTARTFKLAWTGLLTGGGTSLVVTLLMLIKVSIHQHIGADFSGDDVLWTMRQIPAWSLTGALAGAILGLLWPPWQG